MAVFYLDTSAIVKRYKTEKGTDVVNELYDRRSPRDAFITSHFSCLEFEATAARAHRTKLLSQEAYDAMLGSFGYDLEHWLDLVQVVGVRVNNAIDIARNYGLRAGDALQLGTALEVSVESQSRNREFIFVASDRELLDAAAQLPNVGVLDPEAPDALTQLRELRGKK